MAVTTLGNVAVGNPIGLTDGNTYVISGTDKYLSGVTVNSISDVDFTIENGTDITAVDFSHVHSDIYWTKTEIASAFVEIDSILPTAELGDNILDARYYTETELNTSGGGGSVHYDNITNITDVIQIAKATITYNDSTVSIINLPIGAVIWDIKFEVVVDFDGNDPTGNGIIVGNNIDGVDYYLTSSYSLDSVGWKTLSLTNIPNRMNVSKIVSIEYESSGGTETQGSGTIYVHYSLH